MQKLPTHDNKNLSFETVLVLQGGGSLGAYECGVYKTLDKHGIKFDVIAGTSMGGINAASAGLSHRGSEMEPQVGNSRHSRWPA